MSWPAPRLRDHSRTQLAARRRQRRHPVLPPAALSSGSAWCLTAVATGSRPRILQAHRSGSSARTSISKAATSEAPILARVAQTSRKLSCFVVIPRCLSTIRKSRRWPSLGFCGCAAASSQARRRALIPSGVGWSGRDALNLAAMMTRRSLAAMSAVGGWAFAGVPEGAGPAICHHREPTPILRLRYQGSADCWPSGSTWPAAACTPSPIARARPAALAHFCQPPFGLLAHRHDS